MQKKVEKSGHLIRRWELNVQISAKALKILIIPSSSFKNKDLISNLDFLKNKKSQKRIAYFCLMIGLIRI